MIVSLLLSAMILFSAITKTQFFKKGAQNKFMTQLGIAVLVGTITINTLFTTDVGKALKYTAVGIGMMSFIAILIEMAISKKKQTT